MVIDELVAVMGIHDAFGKCHAHGIGQALAERARCGFDAGGVAIFGMTGRARAELAEILDLVDGDVFVTREVKHRIEQHRAMSGRKDKAIAVGPMRRLRIVLEKTGMKNGRNISCAHGKAGMAGIGLLHCICRQKADCIGHLVGFIRIGHVYRLSKRIGNAVSGRRFRQDPKGTRHIAGVIRESIKPKSN